MPFIENSWRCGRFGLDREGAGEPAVLVALCTAMTSTEDPPSLLAPDATSNLLVARVDSFRLFFSAFSVALRFPRVML
jgi:hypothetical protein